MRGTGMCSRFSLSAISLLTWLFGGIILGYVIWVLVTSTATKQFFTGTLVFTYVVLTIGATLFILGLLGCIGSYRGNNCILKTFLVLSVLCVISEIGGIIALNVMKTKMADVLRKTWTEVNQNTKNVVQDHFECCGFVGPEEFVSVNDPIDNSCYLNIMEGDGVAVHQMRKLNRVGCKEKLVDWFYNHKVIWITSLGFFLLFQVSSILLAVYVVNQIKRNSIAPVSAYSNIQYNTHL